MKHAILSLSTLLLATGCTMAPRYTRPEAPVPAQLPAAPQAEGALAADAR